MYDGLLCMVRGMDEQCSVKQEHIHVHDVMYCFLSEIWRRYLRDSNKRCSVFIFPFCGGYVTDWPAEFFVVHVNLIQLHVRLYGYMHCYNCISLHSDKIVCAYVSVCVRAHMCVRAFISFNFLRTATVQATQYSHKHTHTQLQSLSHSPLCLHTPLIHLINCCAFVGNSSYCMCDLSQRLHDNDYQKRSLISCWNKQSSSCIVRYSA